MTLAEDISFSACSSRFQKMNMGAQTSYIVSVSDGQIFRISRYFFFLNYLKKIPFLLKQGASRAYGWILPTKMVRPQTLLLYNMHLDLPNYYLKCFLDLCCFSCDVCTWQMLCLTASSVTFVGSKEKTFYENCL